MNYVLFAFLAGLMTYSFTLLGSLAVVFSKNASIKFFDACQSFAGGVMLCSAYFSLLSPAFIFIKRTDQSSITIFIGFLLGGLLLFLTDKLFTKKFHDKFDNKKRLLLLFAVITIHNIPEGLAVGVAFGSVNHGTTLSEAFFLALGIGIQNFPEGACISLPMKRDGLSIKKAFFFGQLSGIVEPIFSVIGALLVIKISCLMPLILSFAASAMIYVTICEVLPEAQKQNKSLSTFITVLSFAFMMFLDSI